LDSLTAPATQLKEIDFLGERFEKIRSEVEVHFQIQTGKGGPG
jgi:hypothetical protein